MSLRLLEVPRLVPTPREQYLRQNETRIRSLALPLEKDDPAIRTHHQAILLCEDLIEIHDCACDRQKAIGAHRVADTHARYRDSARQLLLHHLDQLAHLLI